MARSSCPSVPLNDGNSIPALGFGVFKVPPTEAEQAVSTALQAGYRHIDTAAVYGNERETGRAVAGSGVPRDELYVVTKLWNSEQGYDSTLAAFEVSMDRLGLDYLDLYLVHWPMPAMNKFVDTFNAFAQVELHPRLPQTELREVHARLGIATEAWGPLGQGTLLENATVTAVAEGHRRTPAQVLIRWHLQLGNIVIPKSVNPERIASNFDVFDFELSETEMASISSLDDGNRLGPDPRTFDFTGR